VNFNFENKGLDFVKHRNKYFLISALLIVIGMAIFLIVGLNLGVDFESGTQLEVLIEEPFTADDVQEVFEEAGFVPDDIRIAGNNNEIAQVTFIGILDQGEISEVNAALTEHYGEIDLNESTVNPIIARELAWQAFWGVLIASLAVILYVMFRFEYRFAGAAIIALFHDALFVIGVFALLRLQVDLTFIAAVLTIVGYSINDTIVIFDRIRENLLRKQGDFAWIVNGSVNEVMGRSLNTSITTVLVLTALFLLGGSGTSNFILALLLGMVSGAYSSLFIASPLLVSWSQAKGER
jgi:preprotein translocase subunit SecF